MYVNVLLGGPLAASSSLPGAAVSRFAIAHPPRVRRKSPVLCGGLKALHSLPQRDRLLNLADGLH